MLGNVCVSIIASDSMLAEDDENNKNVSYLLRSKEPWHVDVVGGPPGVMIP